MAYSFSESTQDTLWTHNFLNNPVKKQGSTRSSKPVYNAIAKVLLSSIKLNPRYLNPYTCIKIDVCF